MKAELIQVCSICKSPECDRELYEISEYYYQNTKKPSKIICSTRLRRGKDYFKEDGEYWILKPVDCCCWEKIPIKKLTVNKISQRIDPKDYKKYGL